MVQVAVAAGLDGSVLWTFTAANVYVEAAQNKILAP